VPGNRPAHSRWIGTKGHHDPKQESHLLFWTDAVLTRQKPSQAILKPGRAAQLGTVQD
jgi:hypothetical protein